MLLNILVYANYTMSEAISEAFIEFFLYIVENPCECRGFCVI